MARKHTRLECPEEEVKHLILPSPAQCRLHRRISLVTQYFPTHPALLTDFARYCLVDPPHLQEYEDCYLEPQIPLTNT